MSETRDIENTFLEIQKLDWDYLCDGCGETVENGNFMLVGINSCCGGGCDRKLCRECVRKSYEAFLCQT